MIADVCRIVDQDSGKSARHRLASSADAVCGIFDLIGLAAATGTILLTPNEQRVAEDRRDCYWLYIVTNCATKPTLQEPVKDPARLEWHEVTKVAHYYLSVNAMTRPMQVREDEAPYGKRGQE